MGSSWSFVCCCKGAVLSVLFPGRVDILKRKKGRRGGRREKGEGGGRGGKDEIEKIDVGKRWRRVLTPRSLAAQAREKDGGGKRESGRGGQFGSVRACFSFLRVSIQRPSKLKRQRGFARPKRPFFNKIALDENMTSYFCQKGSRKRKGAPFTFVAGPSSPLVPSRNSHPPLHPSFSYTSLALSLSRENGLTYVASIFPARHSSSLHL